MSMVKKTAIDKTNLFICMRRSLELNIIGNQFGCDYSPNVLMQLPAFAVIGNGYCVEIKQSRLNNKRFPGSNSEQSLNNFIPLRLTCLSTENVELNFLPNFHNVCKRVVDLSLLNPAFSGTKSFEITTIFDEAWSMRLLSSYY